MRIAAIMPTFGRPRLVANALAQFQAQKYPADLRRLFILDDAGQFGASVYQLPIDGVSPIRYVEELAVQAEPDFVLWSQEVKFATLPAKYAFLVDRAIEWGADAFIPFDDDDIFLPYHLTDHAEVLASHGWSHPKTVLSLYTGRPVEEDARGRFHAALAFRRDYGERVGFWGDVANGRCDYDQAIMGRLRALSPPGQSTHPPTFIMRWGSTRADHCSGRSRGPEDTAWYTDTPISQPGHVDRLPPVMDDETQEMYNLFARD